jgi:hypothetical protein
MSRLVVSPFRAFAFGCLVTAVVALAVGGWARAALTEPAMTPGALLDRAQIEDILVDYYGHLGPGGSDFGSFYVEDGVLDVNGIVAQGRQGIEGLYAKVAQGTPRRSGTFRMLLTNPKIVVNGESATADVIWTGINSPTVSAAPQFIEQGREHDELVKRGGRWYFKHRIITSDGGLPAMFEKTYQRR